MARLKIDIVSHYEKRLKDKDRIIRQQKEIIDQLKGLVEYLEKNSSTSGKED